MSDTRKVVFILGLDSSFTHAATGALQLLGIESGYNSMGSDNADIKAPIEYREILKINEDLLTSHPDTGHSFTPVSGGWGLTPHFTTISDRIHLFFTFFNPQEALI